MAARAAAGIPPRLIFDTSCYTVGARPEAGFVVISPSRRSCCRIERPAATPTAAIGPKPARPTLVKPPNRAAGLPDGRRPANTPMLRLITPIIASIPRHAGGLKHMPRPSCFFVHHQGRGHAARTRAAVSAMATSRPGSVLTADTSLFDGSGRDSELVELPNNDRCGRARTHRRPLAPDAFVQVEIGPAIIDDAALLKRGRTIDPQVFEGVRDGARMLALANRP